MLLRCGMRAVPDKPEGGTGSAVTQFLGYRGVRCRNWEKRRSPYVCVWTYGSKLTDIWGVETP